MLYLLFALLASTGIIITFRLFENYQVNILRAIGINYIIAAGYGYLSLAGTFSFTSLPGKPWFPFALIIGIIFIIGFNLFALSVRYAGVAVTAISSRMSVVIPVTFGFILFHDPAPAIKIAGIMIALCSFYFIFSKNEHQQSTGKYLYLPLLLFLVNGTGDLMMKISQQYHIGEEFVLFLSTVFLTALFLAFMMMTFKMRQGGWRFKRQDLIGGVALGLLNWWSTICFLRGLKAFDVTWFLPIYNVGVVVISALVGYFIFREGLRIRNWIGVALAVIAMIMIVFSNQDKNPEIIIKTELGDIKVALYKAAAPLTVSNFLKYVDEGAYKDITFYRVVRPDNTTNPVSIDVIQGGMDEKINVDSLPPIPHESTDKTGILHKDGVISMARYGPGTATSEFFICVGDQTELDSGGKRNPDGFGFAAFGKVTEGMDVVREIYKGETEGDFQRLVKPIRIIEIRRIK